MESIGNDFHGALVGFSSKRPNQRNINIFNVKMTIYNYSTEP